MDADQVCLHVGGGQADKYEPEAVGLVVDGQSIAYTVDAPEVSVFVAPTGRHRAESLWLEVKDNKLSVKRLVGPDQWAVIYESAVAEPQVELIVNRGRQRSGTDRTDGA